MKKSKHTYRRMLRLCALTIAASACLAPTAAPAEIDLEAYLAVPGGGPAVRISDLRGVRQAILARW